MNYVFGSIMKYGREMFNLFTFSVPNEIYLLSSLLFIRRNKRSFHLALILQTIVFLHTTKRRRDFQKFGAING